MPTLTVIKAGRSGFWSTNSGISGSGIGDGATAYGEDDWQWLLMAAFAPNIYKYGVFSNFLNELIVTGKNTTGLTLDSGMGVSYGRWFYLDGALKMPFITPAAGSTGGVVILYVNWAAKTVRPAVYMNDEGNSAHPALTPLRNACTTWATCLAKFVVNSAGVVTNLADCRGMMGWSAVGSSVFSCDDLANCDLQDIGDVNLTTYPPATGTTIIWDGTQWIEETSTPAINLPTAVLSCSTPSLGSGDFVVDGSASTPGTIGKSIVNYAWELYDSNNILIDSFNGAPGDPVTGSTYATSGTFDVVGLDMTPAGSDTYTVSLVVTDNAASVSTAVTCSKVIQLEAILLNGDFENGSVNFSAYNATWQAQTSEVYAGVYSAVYNQAGSLGQLLQSNVELTAGTNYTLTFWAKADALLSIDASLLKHTSPYTNYGLSQTYNLTNTWQQFTTNFTASGFVGTSNDIRFRFWQASLLSTNIYFDDVYITIT